MSLKSKFDNLKEQHRIGGRYVRKFGSRTPVFEKFSPQRMQAIQTEMDRMLSAYNPKMHIATGDLLCNRLKPNSVIKRCESILVKKGDTITQGTTYIHCMGCGHQHKLDVYPERPNRKSAIHNPQS
jgi:hypothetical protein